MKGSTNRELFASDNPQILQVLQENEKKLQSKDLEQMMGTVLAGCTPYEAGSYIMTDDKAPVELLGIKVIDQLIQDEVAYYKDIYHEEGIKGVMDHL